MKLVPCVAWVKQGVPAAKPQKIRVDREDLRNLLQGTTAETSDGDEDDEGGEEEEGVKERGKAKGLRGSNPNSDDEAASGSTDPLAKYNMADYDNDDAETPKEGSSTTKAVASGGGGGTRVHMRGLACHATPTEDPYVTEHGQHGDGEDDDGWSDEEDDREDFLIQPTDNLVLVAKIVKEEYNLEVWVYNDAEKDFYVHHDYMLEQPPLCLAPIGYDPGNDQSNYKGNLCAIGDMSPVVSIWDLDLVDSLAPVVTLGGLTGAVPPSKKRRKGGNSAAEATPEGHSDSVLDIAWNPLTEHVLATASADNTVLLWDLDRATVASALLRHTDKVQSLDWHPAESSLLLSGDCSGVLRLTDCRTPEAESAASWSLGASSANGTQAAAVPGAEHQAPSAHEVEKVRWHARRPFYCLATTGDGRLHLVDSRRADVAVSSVQATAAGTTGSVGALAVCATNECLVTGGDDGRLRLWRVEKETKIVPVAEMKPKLGKIQTVQFRPDLTSAAGLASVVAVGGDKGDYVRVIDLSSVCEFSEMFGGGS